MPSWLFGQTTPSTSGSTAASVYHHQRVMQQALSSQTATTSGASAQLIYLQQATTATSGLGTVYTGASASSAIWGNTTIIWEDEVTPAQYLALARNRVEYTEEQRQAMLRAQEELNRRMAEESERRQRRAAQNEEQRRAALGRSRELLLEHLTPAQRRTFEENAWFIVQGGVTKKRYRIRTTGYTGNIEELERGHSERATHRLCGHLSGSYALYDHHVAQKISLECDEEAFVALCNRSAAGAR